MGLQFNESLPSQSSCCFQSSLYDRFSSSPSNTPPVSHASLTLTVSHTMPDILMKEQISKAPDFALQVAEISDIKPPAKQLMSASLQRPEARRTVNFVYKSECSHADFCERQILLQQNEIWDIKIVRRLERTVEFCKACCAASKPFTWEKVSLPSSSEKCNSAVRLPHAPSWSTFLSYHACQGKILNWCNYQRYENDG